MAVRVNWFKPGAGFAAGVLLLSATAHAADAPVLPVAKPDGPAIRTVAAPVLPTRKPPYFGPFGADYAYLLEKDDRETFSRALSAAERRRWASAIDLVEEIENPLPGHVIAWLYLRETGARTPFKARTEFIRAHADWPDITSIRQRSEDVARDGTLSDEDLIAWFEDFPPLTGSGMAQLAYAYKNTGREKDAVDLAHTAWREGTFTSAEEREFLREFDDVLTPEDHKARLNRLLWDEHTTGANRMLRRVDEDTRKLAQARIALMTSSYGVDSAIAKVPAALQSDSGLVYDRLKWRRKRSRYDSAAELLGAENVDQERPDLWWKERHILAREALSEGRVTDAYDIASRHKATDALSVFEAEWLAGWIQLRFLKDPEQALPHFYKVYDAVAFPVSLSRGAYWIGRAAEAGGDADLARSWYEKAAIHVTTYYGQLALAKLTGGTLPQLPLDPLPTMTERNTFHQSDLAQVVRMLVEIGNTDYLRSFVLAAADASDFATERHLAAEMVSRFNRPDLGVWIARRAAQEHIVLLKYGFPAPQLEYPDEPERALLLAITRQESNFDVAARSWAGARGLMQLMPATARVVSRQLNERYDRDALTVDAAYNVRLGSKYLGDLIDQFDGSYIMAIAGYNAGPHRVRRWIREFGDPRTPEVDPIDWVEQIPFTETRNYVQRVMENLQVYRAVLDNTQQLAQTLPSDLSRPATPAVN
jgi:soluble lytic murein transglycosylase